MLGEALGHALTNTAGTTRDEGNFAFEQEILEDAGHRLIFSIAAVLIPACYPEFINPPRSWLLEPLPHRDVEPKQRMLPVSTPPAHAPLDP
jgi:hypothetical protein